MQLATFSRYFVTAVRFSLLFPHLLECHCQSKMSLFCNFKGPDQSKFHLSTSCLPSETIIDVGAWLAPTNDIIEITQLASHSALSCLLRYCKRSWPGNSSCNNKQQ